MLFVLLCNKAIGFVIELTIGIVLYLWHVSVHMMSHVLGCVPHCTQSYIYDLCHFCTDSVLVENPVIMTISRKA